MRTRKICVLTLCLCHPLCPCALSEDEELTINYFEGADPGQWVEPAHTIVCQCESNRCRRKLVAIPDE